MFWLDQVIFQTIPEIASVLRGYKAEKLTDSWNLLHIFRISGMSASAASIVLDREEKEFLDKRLRAMRIDWLLLILIKAPFCTQPVSQRR